MKFISWNVNGLRACITKGFFDFVKDAAPDILALQETKMQPEQLSLELPGYTQYWNSALKKGCYVDFAARLRGNLPPEEPYQFNLERIVL